ncbi:hypothetical protein ABIB57_001934 [Devosia sp. UYZn731]|uniref:lipase/acyltransferase domain-containing protein n=1 Tax=Devosia sp. UYZn731 TaxID=3156345 RepID=UPI0033978A60
MSRFSDVVILIPGIIGSELSKDGQVIWGASASVFWNALALDGISKLALHAQGSLDEDIGDGVVATGILRRPALIPDFWKIGTYQDLSAGLQSALGLSNGQNFFEFAYDWRRDNRVAASKLAKAAHVWLAAWRGSSGNDKAKLILVAHSMGGLVARHFVEAMDGWKTTKATFAVSTPFGGSGNAISFLSNGLQKRWMPGHVSEAINKVRDFDSIYQLLPTGEFVTDGAGKASRVIDVTIPNIDRGRAIEALKFHTDLSSRAKSNLDESGYAQRRGPMRTVIGTEQPTSGFATLQPDGSILCDGGTSGNRLLWGDGTVPRASATPAEVGEEVAAFVPTGHAVIPSHQSTIAHITNAIAGLPEVTLRDRGGHGTISLIIEDMYPVDEPVIIHAITGVSAQYLELTIKPVDSATAPFTTRMYPKDGRYRWQGDLPVGVYEATAACMGAEAAGDIFFVQPVFSEHP